MKLIVEHDLQDSNLLRTTYPSTGGTRVECDKIVLVEYRAVNKPKDADSRLRGAFGGRLGPETPRDPYR